MALIFLILFWFLLTWRFWIQIFFAEFYIALLFTIFPNFRSLAMTSSLRILFSIFRIFTSLTHSHGILSLCFNFYMILRVDALWFIKFSFRHNTILKHMQGFLSGRHEKVLQFLLIICPQTLAYELFLKSFYGSWTPQECLTSFEYLLIIREILLDIKFLFLFTFPLEHDWFHLCCILCRSLNIDNSNSTKLCRHNVGFMVKYIIFYNNEWRYHILLPQLSLSFLGRVGGQTKFRIFAVRKNQDWPMLVIFNKLPINNFLVVFNHVELFLRIIKLQGAIIIHQYSFSIIHKRFRSCSALSKYEVISCCFRLNYFLLFM